MIELECDLKSFKIMGMLKLIKRKSIRTRKLPKDLNEYGKYIL